MRIVNQDTTAYTSINVNQEQTSWSSATSYALGASVTRNNKTYVSCITSNLNNDPENDDGKWFNCGVDNKFAALDLDSDDSTYCNASTITSGTSYDLTITVPTNAADRVVIVGAEGSQITIYEKTSSDTLVNTITKSIDETQQNPAVNVAFQPAPTATKAEIIVSEKTTGSYSAIQYLIVGEETIFGSTRYNASFSVGGEAEVFKSQNGITYIDKEDEGDIVEVNAVFDSSDFMTTKRNAKHYKYVKAGFVFDEEDASIYENLCLCGYLEAFDVVVSNPIKTFASIEIKEL